MIFIDRRKMLGTLGSVPFALGPIIGCASHAPQKTADPDMVERLTRLGAPVKLAIGLDSVFQTTLSGKVGRYINFYIGNGAGTRVARGKNLQGELSNVDVENIPGGVGHVTIDKNEIIQQKVISAILSSL